ncbi:MAG: hypothetical protein H0X40_00825 [Chthoniobacterales bacterium]|nr:hypothetical protein [Chthoniobacterales bacterium]
MRLTDFFASLRRQDENATVIFSEAEPIGRATDLVMPYRPFFSKQRRQNSSPARTAATPNEQ